MQCGVEERTIRSIRVVVECFKCREKGHKCRECPLKEKKTKRVVCPNRGKVHQEKRKLVRSVKGKVQEGEKRLRRVEVEEVARPAKGKVQQEEWKRSL